MELIANYSSDISDSEVSIEVNQDQNLDPAVIRSVYLLTYSQADIERVPSRRDFARAAVQAFECCNANVLHWSCCLENHEDTGVHYHLAVRLDKCSRWIAAKQYLTHRLGIQVNFSNRHHNYHSAWKYVVKSDGSYEESPGHPRLSFAKEPNTNAASIARHRRRRPRQVRRISEHNEAEGDSDTEEEKGEKKKKRKRLTAYEVSTIIIDSGSRTITELQALANEQKKEGKIDLAEFLVSRTPRAVADILQSTWEIENAPEKLERAQKTRMELLQQAQEGRCVEGCNGQWIVCANEILTNNGISEMYFKDAVKLLLQQGRGKYRNIMLIGPANCGKTFLFNPLRKVYEAFSNPATGSFAWVGVEKAEVIFLNDFRWSQQLIPWHDLLLLLEGQEVHFQAPKTHFVKDISLTTDTPIFCTSKNPLMYIKNGVLDERETDMMRVRWNVIVLNHQIPRETQRDVPSCAKCFADFILN